MSCPNTRMMRNLLLVVMLMVGVTIVDDAQSNGEESNQVRATTEDGRSVILYADGTWEYEDTRLYDV